MVVRLLMEAKEYIKTTNQVKRDTQDLGRTMEKENKKAEVFGKTIDNLGTGMSNLAGQMRAMAALGSPMEQLKRGVSLAAEAESMEVSFGVMLGSAEKAKKMVASLQKFAAETPFTMTGLTQATKTLLQFGITGDEVLPLIKSLGDVSGGESEKLQRLSLAFGQMSATGRLMGEEVNQMVEAGFNPLKEISRTTGRSMAVLRGEMEQGKISTEMVTKAFKSASSEGGPFFNLMEKQSKTLKGTWSTMTDDIDSAQRSVGKAVIEMFSLKDIVESVSKAAQEFDTRFSSMDKTLKDIITLTVTLVGILSGFWVAWKVGAIAVGMFIGVLKDLIITVKWLIGTGLVGLVKWLYSVATAANIATVALVAFKSAAIIGGILALLAAFGHLDNEITGVNDAVKDLDSQLRKTGNARAAFAVGSGQRTDRMLAERPGENPGERLGRLNAELQDAQKNAQALERDLDKANSELADMRLEKRISDFIPFELDADIRFKQLKEAANEFSTQLDQARNRAARLAEEVKTLSPEKLNDAVAKSASDFTKKLELEIQSVGKTSEQIELLKLKQTLYTPAVAASAAGDELKAKKLYEAADATLLASQRLSDYKKALDAEQKAKEKVAEESKKLKEKADDLIESVELEIMTFGMAADEAKLFEFSMKGLDQATFNTLQDLQLTKAALEENKKLMDFGKQVADEFATANDKYTTRVGELTAALNAGAISEALFNEAMKDAQKKLQEAEDSAKGARQEIEKLEGVLSGSAEAKFRVEQYRALARGQIPRPVRSFATAEGFPTPEPQFGGGSDFDESALAEKQNSLLTNIRDILQIWVDVQKANATISLVPAEFTGAP